MSMSDAQIREHVLGVVMSRLDSGPERRKEALREYFGVSMPALSEQEKDCLVECIPSVMPSLYRRWTHLFAARLLETVPRDQLEHLCDGGQANDASLLLVFIMFLESERMEKQTAEDLEAYGRAMSGHPDLGGLASEFLRTRLAALKADQESASSPGRMN